MKSKSFNYSKGSVNFCKGSVYKKGKKNKALIARKMLLMKRKVRTKKGKRNVKNENSPRNKSVLSSKK